jgi:glycosyltransferase involved in cell wall biosynthesis
LAPTRPTILQIIPELDTGGAERTTIEIAAAIARAGGRALVLSEGGRLDADLAAAGGELVRFPAGTKNPLRMLLNAGRIAHFVTDEGVDLIHARSRAPAWSALVAARRTRRPLVTTYHGAYNETNAAKKAYNAVMAKGDITIANSRYTAGLVASRYGTPDDRLCVIYRGVDGTQFDPDAIAPARIAALRAAWRVGADTPIVLHAARLTGWKGQPVVIEAARLLRERGSLGDAHMILAGDAQGRETYRDGLATAIAAAGLGERVHLVGHVADMAAAFCTAHVAVVASTEPEAFGRAATEAEAMACPVIATRLGAPPETVLATPDVPPDQSTGWLVPPGDAAALADALASALALSPEARAAIGERARRHVLAAFSLAAMQRQTLAVYDRLLGTRLAEAFGRA